MCEVEIELDKFAVLDLLQNTLDGYIEQIRLCLTIDDMQKIIEKIVNLEKSIMSTIDVLVSDGDMDERSAAIILHNLSLTDTDIATLVIMRALEISSSDEELDDDIDEKK